MSLRITKVYTRGGDQGTTRLAGGQRLPKDHVRIESYGSTDELMAVFALVRQEYAQERQRIADPARAALFANVLEYIQNKLFTLGGELATRAEDRHPQMETITEEDVLWLEKLCDHYNETLPPLKDFVLPGGTRTNAALHLARTVARRAERHLTRLSREEDLGPHPLRWLNRLSDALFVLCRWSNTAMGEPEVLWRHRMPAPVLPEQT